MSVEVEIPCFPSSSLCCGLGDRLHAWIPTVAPQHVAAYAIHFLRSWLNAIVSDLPGHGTGEVCRWFHDFHRTRRIISEEEEDDHHHHHHRQLQQKQQRTTTPKHNNLKINYKYKNTYSIETMITHRTR